MIHLLPLSISPKFQFLLYYCCYNSLLRLLLFYRCFPIYPVHISLQNLSLLSLHLLYNSELLHYCLSTLPLSLLFPIRLYIHHFLRLRLILSPRNLLPHCSPLSRLYQSLLSRLPHFPSLPSLSYRCLSSSRNLHNIYSPLFPLHSLNYRNLLPYPNLLYCFCLLPLHLLNLPHSDLLVFSLRL